MLFLSLSSCSHFLSSPCSNFYVISFLAYISPTPGRILINLVCLHSPRHWRSEMVKFIDGLRKLTKINLKVVLVRKSKISVTQKVHANSAFTLGHNVASQCRHIVAELWRHCCVTVTPQTGNSSDTARQQCDATAASLLRNSCAAVAQLRRNCGVTVAQL